MLRKASQLLKAPPDIPTLHQLLAKCFQQPGEKLQVQWRSADNHLFLLDVVYSLKERRPNWQLLSEKSGRRTIIADYSGHDILLVYKQITTAANNALEARGEDLSRLSRTKDARAAATTWLEGKAESALDNSSPPAPQQGSGGGGFWSEDTGAMLGEPEQTSSGVAAAIDESPWATTTPQTSGQQANVPLQAPLPYPTRSTFMQQQAAPQQEEPAPLPFPNWDKTSSRQGDSAFNWASTVTPGSAPGGAPQAPGQAPPPAPVKVTGPGPQANQPKSVQSPPKNPAQEKARERALMHPDKGAGAVDKGGTMQSKQAPPGDKAAPAKKPPPPDKPAQAAKPAPEKPPAEKPPAEKPPEKPEPPRLTVPASGDLTTTTVPKLFKQLKESRFGGKLEFADESLNANVILEEGKPIEAWFGELRGDAAVLEVLLWTSGQYMLTPGINATVRNVKSTPEVLVEHNKNISYLLEELAGEGLTATSTFSPANAQLSSDEFNQLATPDAPMELEKLARLYIKLDGKKTIAELNELQVLPRPELVQAIHHLYFNSLIDIIDPTLARKEFVAHPKELDQNAIQQVMVSLRRVDTGLFTYPAFQYFLQEEFFRIYRAKSSMSVIIFEMRQVVAAEGLVRRMPLSIDAIADATMRISSCKRHTDVVAHYEENDYAIILPNTGSGGTKVFASKIIKALTDAPLAGTEGKTISFAFGSASIPEDFKELSMLLGAAEVAMSFARQRGKPLVLFKEMEI